MLSALWPILQYCVRCDLWIWGKYWGLRVKVTIKRYSTARNQNHWQCFFLWSNSRRTETWNTYSNCSETVQFWWWIRRIKFVHGTNNHLWILKIVFKLMKSSSFTFFTVALLSIFFFQTKRNIIIDWETNCFYSLQTCPPNRSINFVIANGVSAIWPMNANFVPLKILEEIVRRNFVWCRTICLTFDQELAELFYTV